MAYPCRLRAYRKAFGLSQRELAVLLGLRSQGLIAEFEAGKKRPGAETLIACALIFDQPIAVLFPRLEAKTILGVRTRALRLRDDVKPHRPRTHARLSGLITRITSAH